MTLYRMFGLEVSSSFELVGLKPEAGSTEYPRRVTVELVARREVSERFSGSSGAHRTLPVGPGEAVEITLGRGADTLLSYEHHAVFHISPGGTTVLCAPSDASATRWQRVLLDTVMATAALAHGYEALHAGAVALGDQVIAIASATGGGKSTLCLEMIRRGACLFADDLVFLSRDRGQIVAHPGPPLMNLPHDGEQGEFAERIATFDGEDWIAVKQGESRSRALSAIVVLDRRPSVGDARIDLERSPEALLTAALDPSVRSERRRARFELIADLADETPLLHLSANAETPSVRLAELVESACARLGSAR